MKVKVTSRVILRDGPGGYKKRGKRSKECLQNETRFP